MFQGPKQFSHTKYIFLWKMRLDSSTVFENRPKSLIFQYQLVTFQLLFGAKIQIFEKLEIVQKWFLSDKNEMRYF